MRYGIYAKFFFWLDHLVCAENDDSSLIAGLIHCWKTFRLILKESFLDLEARLIPATIAVVESIEFGCNLNRPHYRTGDTRGFQIPRAFLKNAFIVDSGACCVSVHSLT